MDNPEEKENTHDTLRTAETTANNAVIGKSSHQERWRNMESAHYLKQEESATDLFFQPGERGKNSSKFTINGLDEQKQHLAWKPADLTNGVLQKTKDISEGIIYPDRNHEDIKMHYLEDFNAFYTTNLIKYGIEPFIIAAITRNEIEHRKLFIDDSQDIQVKTFGQALGLKPERISIGNQQLQPINIARLLNAKDTSGKPLYPQLEAIQSAPLKKAIDPKYGAVLMGAYLQDVARRLESGEDPIPSYDKTYKEQITKKMRTLWASGDPEQRTDALIRSYNPGDGQLHVNNVRRHLQKIKDTVGSLFI